MSDSGEKYIDIDNGATGSGKTYRSQQEMANATCQYIYAAPTYQLLEQTRRDLIETYGVSSLDIVIWYSHSAKEVDSDIPLCLRFFEQAALRDQARNAKELCRDCEAKAKCPIFAKYKNRAARIILVTHATLFEGSISKDLIPTLKSGRKIIFDESPLTGTFTYDPAGARGGSINLNALEAFAPSLYAALSEVAVLKSVSHVLDNLTIAHLQGVSAPEVRDGATMAADIFDAWQKNPETDTHGLTPRKLREMTSVLHAVAGFAFNSAIPSDDPNIVSPYISFVQRKHDYFLEWHPLKRINDVWLQDVDSETRATTYTAPIRMLSATPGPIEAIEAVMKRPARLLPASEQPSAGEARENATIIQVIGTRGKHKLEQGSELWAIIEITAKRALADMHRAKGRGLNLSKTLVATHKTLKTAAASMLETETAFHYGGTIGSNEYENVSSAIFIGHNRPNNNVLVAEIEAVRGRTLCDDGTRPQGCRAEQLEFFSNRRVEMLKQQFGDKKKVFTWKGRDIGAAYVQHHEDPAIMEYLNFRCSEATTQELGRLRANRRTADNPLLAVVFSNQERLHGVTHMVHIDTIKRHHELEDELPVLPFVKGRGSNEWALSGTALAKLYPSKFATERAARWFSDAIRGGIFVVDWPIWRGNGGKGKNTMLLRLRPDQDIMAWQQGLDGYSFERQEQALK